MSINQNTHLDDEFDLKGTFLALWRGKMFIILMSFLGLLNASYYLQTVERKYTVQYNLKPVTESKNSLPSAQLGGLASLAGIQLPSNSSNDFKIFKELITSEETAKIIFRNKKLIKNIFKSEWNEDLNDYSQPLKNKIQTFKSDLKKIITGNNYLKYSPPNARRLSDFINKNIQITNDKETGFLIFRSETPNPENILELIIEATKASDSIMRQRYIDFSTEPLVFYKEKLRTARSREHREALAELISKEEQKLMFASKGKHFIAEPYINPTISLYPTTPKPKLILALSLVLGLFLGAAFVLMRHAIKKDRV